MLTSLCCGCFDFYPRSPCGERHVRITHNPGPGYFYPRSPCGERRLPVSAHCFDGWISIHALLAESDTSEVSERVPLAISIHALLAESDQDKHHPHHERGFLSTLSLRRATLAGPSGPAFLYNFYPRSPCGERRVWAFSAGFAF